MEEKFLSVRELARRLHVSIPSIRRYIAEGHLKAVTLPGGYFRIPESEIEKMLGLEPTPKGAADDMCELCELYQGRGHIEHRLAGE